MNPQQHFAEHLWKREHRQVIVRRRTQTMYILLRLLVCFSGCVIYSERCGCCCRLAVGQNKRKIIWRGKHAACLITASPWPSIHPVVFVFTTFDNTRVLHQPQQRRGGPCSREGRGGGGGGYLAHPADFDRFSNPICCVVMVSGPQ